MTAVSCFSQVKQDAELTHQPAVTHPELNPSLPFQLISSHLKDQRGQELDRRRQVKEQTNVGDTGQGVNQPERVNNSHKDEPKNLNMSIID